MKSAEGLSFKAFTSLPSTLCSGLRSAAAGATLSIKPINLPVPISFKAETQNTGNSSWFNIPAFIPCRISSSFKVPFSKKSSSNVSSFSAAFSINSLFNSLAHSFWSSGISNFSGFPPSGENLYIFILSTSTIHCEPSITKGY